MSMDLTREEIYEMMKNAVREVIAERPKTDKEWLSVSEAVIFLGEQGYITTEKYIYQLRYRNSIPYARINGKLTFSRKELQKWVREQVTFDSEASKRDAMLALSQGRGRRGSKTA